MATSLIAARSLIEHLEQLSAQKLELGDMTTAIHQAPDAAFREKVDDLGNLLLHKAICILRKGNEKTPMYLSLTEILKKDNGSARMAKNDLGQLPLHLACNHGINFVKPNKCIVVGAGSSQSYGCP